MPSPSLKHTQVQQHLADAEELSLEVQKLVTNLIGRVADQWTMIIIDVLAEHGELRFSQVEQHLRGTSQKMLSQTLRGLECDGLLARTVHAEVAPRVQYRLTDLGLGLGRHFVACGSGPSKISLQLSPRARTTRAAGKLGLHAELRKLER